MSNRIVLGFVLFAFFSAGIAGAFIAADADASIRGDDLVNHPVSDVDSALQGHVPGVQITNDGQPGASPSIRIRGVASANAPSDVLFIVDGVAVDNINDIPPSDIQSIEILKDASSTAIYGTRGLGGVILVTTVNGAQPYNAAGAEEVAAEAQPYNAAGAEEVAAGAPISLIVGLAAVAGLSALIILRRN